MIEPQMAKRLYAYLAEVLNNAKCPAICVGGHRDHVHLFFALGRTAAIADVIEEVKSSSSKWMKTHGTAGFYWQAGYGAFSIGQSDANKLVRYIEAQEEHHRTQTFQEEFLKFLERYQVEYDERYIWE